MEEKNGFFPVDVTISVPLEKGKMFLAGKFDDFISFLSEEHSYVLYRFLPNGMRNLRTGSEREA